MRFFLSLCAVSVRAGVGMRRFERRIWNQRCSLAIADTLRKTNVREIKQPNAAPRSYESCDFLTPSSKLKNKIGFCFFLLEKVPFIITTLQDHLNWSIIFWSILYLCIFFSNPSNFSFKKVWVWKWGAEKLLSTSRHQFVFLVLLRGNASATYWLLSASINVLLLGKSVARESWWCGLRILLLLAVEIPNHYGNAAKHKKNSMESFVCAILLPP